MRGHSFTAAIAQRLLGAILVLWGVSIIVFGIVHLVPGDVASALLGADANPEDVARLRTSLGLDEPAPVQYAIWLGNTLRGDLGKSIRLRKPVVEAVAESFRATIILTAAALLVAVAIGIPAGIVSAVKRGSALDRLVLVLALLGNSMPTFWLGIMAILVLSGMLGWFPSSGMTSARAGGDLPDILRHLVLPAATLGLVSAGLLARMTRSAMLDVLGQEYVLVAHAKGLHRWTVIVRHALRSALPSIVTVVALQTGFLLSGAVSTETVFSWPGLGYEMFRAITVRDVPIIQGGVLLIGTVFVLVNTLADIALLVLDPRVKHS